MPELETVDLIGVEILSAGGPIRGVGSPPEGDFYTIAQLASMAEADRELGAQVKPPNKIGHSNAQALLKNSDLPVPTPGEMPAAGWLENLRVNDTGEKLLADIKAVPKKVAELIKAGAYRTRSVELAKVTTQTADGSGKVYDWVVSGLAWLGGKMPAVQTLDDVYALYELEQLRAFTFDDAGGLEIEAKAVTFYAAPQALVWAPEDSFQDLRDDVGEALNGPPAGGMVDPRFWVADINLARDKALVQDYYDNGTDGWIVPFTTGQDGSVAIAPSSDWTAVEQGWVQSATEYERAFATSRPDDSPAPADTPHQMPELTLTKEQRKAYADALGVAEDALTDEQVTAAEALAATLPAPAVDEETTVELEAVQKRANEADERSRKLETELHEERRIRFVTDLLSSGKIEPGEKEKWEKRYDADPQIAREYAADLKVNEELARTFGSDDDDLDVEAQRELEDEQYAGHAVALGIEGELL